MRHIPYATATTPQRHGGRTLASVPPEALNRPPTIRRGLVDIVDDVPETRGLGVVLIDFGVLQRLRPPGPDGVTVVFERRVRPHSYDLALTRPPLPDPEPRRPPPTNGGQPRTARTSPVTEWVNLGFNCGGAVLSWIGVVGLTKLTPVTGGVSTAGAVVLYGGAVATSGQCVVSSGRVYNVLRGRTDVNDALDDSKVYTYTMLAADGMALVGAGGAIRELRRTNAVLQSSGYSLRQAGRGESISRPMRRRLTGALELQGATRVAGQEINRVVRQRLLDGAAGALGMVASGHGGVMNFAFGHAWDVVVWITEETGE